MDNQEVHLQKEYKDETAGVCGWTSDEKDWCNILPYAVWYNLDFITCPTCLASPEFQKLIVERMKAKMLK